MKWKKINYRGFDLTVSSSGHIIYEGKFLRHWGNPYHQVRTLHTNHLVHRVVAKAFCKGYSENLVVNHKRGNKKDNIEKHLEWCTSGENVQHAHRTGLIKYKTKKA